MVLVNRKNKIHFINDGLNKESLDDIIQILKSHPSGYDHCVLLDLLKLFSKEKDCYNIKNLMVKDIVCLFINDKLSKESLDNTNQNFKLHPSGDIHYIPLDLLKLFSKEKDCYNL